MVAILMMLGAQLFIAFSNVLVKLNGMDTPVFQLILYRQLIASFLVFPFVYKIQGQIKPSPHYKSHIVRAILMILGNALFFIAVINLPLSSVSATIYVAPIFLMILSALFLNESVGYYRWAAIFIGFLGVLMISQPSTSNVFLLIALFAALTTALNSMIMKAYSTKEHPFVTLFWVNMFAMLFLIPAAVYEDKPFSISVVIIGAIIGLFYIAMIYLVIHAFRRLDASLLAPAEYSGLLFAALLGWLILNETIDALAWCGIFLVLFSSLLPNINKFASKQNSA